MGKWTASHYEDVLGSKMKNLIVGAIERSKLETTEPVISYKSFIEDLDTGDSFTTTIIDILVKELAERRTRAHSADRRLILISERSSKSLRSLGSLHVYRDRNAARTQARRTFNLTEYLTAPPEEMDMEEDDDEFESMLGSVSVIEGARVNPELHDAYSYSAPQTAIPAGTTESRTTEPVISPLHSPPIPNRSGPWTLPPAATTLISSGLSRHPSLRRPNRSRTVDFHEFTARRRITNRQSSAQDALDARLDATSEEPSNLLISRHMSPIRDDQASTTRGSARRFFPFSRRRQTLESSSSSAWNDGASGSFSADEPLSYFSVQPTRDSNLDEDFGRWFSNTESLHGSQPQVSAPATAPRLRRGGLRAPESLLSRHASPPSIDTRTLTQNPAPIRLPASPLSDNGPVEVAAYPTPDATDSQNDSTPGS